MSLFRFRVEDLEAVAILHGAGLRTLLKDLDSKDLADMPLKLPAPEIAALFAGLPEGTSKAVLERLVRRCFDTDYSDIKEWVPPDIPDSCPSWLFVSEGEAPQVTQEDVSGGGQPDQHTIKADICQGAAGRSVSGWPEAARDAAAMVNCNAMYKFAGSLVNLWAELGRKTSCASLYNHSSCEETYYNVVASSLVDLPHGFIVPGGRFREMYYWDSYWTIRGLLYSGMVSTARNMILNFAALVRMFGFIPNGNRSYYLNRSQPPVFSMMLAAYFAFTGDLELIQDTYSDVEREYLRWRESPCRRICVPSDGKNFYLSRYLGHSAEPRPESWSDDVQVASFVADRAVHEGFVEPEAARASILRNIRAAAESGWDFSSRWVADDVDVNIKGVLPNLGTESLLPVDLNSFLYHAELYLFHFGRILQGLGDHLRLRRRRNSTAFYHQCAVERREAMLKLLWNDQVNWWFDFDISKGRQSSRVTAAGVVPFFMELHSSLGKQMCRLFECSDSEKGTASCVPYTHDEESSAGALTEVEAQKQQTATARFLVKDSKLWNTWGMATTQLDTGQQWDGSNCWPPLLQMALEALINLEDCVTLKFAERMTANYIASCMTAYNKWGALPKKSSSLSPGSPGSGGEYECQKGFGWSIGVALELMFFRRGAFRCHEIRRLRREFGTAAFKRTAEAS